MNNPRGSISQSLHSLLQEFTTEIYTSLKEFADLNGLKGTFTGGVMPHLQAGAGSVFYEPNADPDEEGIGAEWDVFKDSHKDQGYISIWLGWTHGKVLKDYCNEKVFSWKSDKDMANELRKILWSFKTELIVDLEKEIAIPRAPYHHRDKYRGG